MGVFHLTDYLKIYNIDHNVAISQFFQSWKLSQITELKEYITEYATNAKIRFVSDNNVNDNDVGKDMEFLDCYYGIIPDSINSINVFVNPSAEPAYICAGAGATAIYDHYDKPATDWVMKFKGNGTIFRIYAKNRNVAENIKVLTFSAEKNSNNSDNYGIQIFDENKTLLFSGTDFPLKVIASRKTDYSETPRYFYRGTDDVQTAVYNSNNYFSLSDSKKHYGFFCDVQTITTRYSGTHIYCTLVATVAKLSKNAIATGVMEMHYHSSGDPEVKRYLIDGTEIPDTGKIYGVSRFFSGTTCEQSMFSIFDVTNYY
nr:MAG TPA: hypothetical protein [Caudoviricetes sp.]